MKVILSQTLSSKLRYLKGRMSIKGVVDPISYQDMNGLTQHIPGAQYILVIVDLSDHPDPDYDIKQCKEWMRIIDTYFSTSYKAYKVDVGPFKGLYPKIIKENEIQFQCEDFDHKPTWRDWFIMEGDKNAPKLTIELLSHICDPG